MKKSGPLFCGGITVFNPIVQLGIQPTNRVGVIGIGGLGHLALQFLNKWGCEVSAFSHSSTKEQDAFNMGAHRFLNSTEPDKIDSFQGYFDFILSTVNTPLDWGSYINLLAPKGKFHTVGAIPEPVALEAFPLIMGQRSFSGSPLGSPYWTAKMLEFCQRHQIEAVVETFPMSKANEAFEHLKSGKAKYRIVLENDLN